MRRVVIILLLVALAAWLAYRFFRPAPAGQTVLVRRGTISAIIETTGQLQPTRQARIAPHVSGVVAQVPVRPGSQVAAGDVLLELSSPALERALRQAELNLEIQDLSLIRLKSAASDAAIEIAKARLRQATVVLQAAQKAYDEIADEEDAATSDEAIALEGAKVSYEIAKAEFDRTLSGATSSEISLQQRQRDLAALSLEAAREQIAQTLVRAPFAGTVLEVSIRQNEFASAGSQLILLGDTTQLEIIAWIDEIDIGQVMVGQRVEIILDAFPGKPLTGVVGHINPAATPQRGATVYETTIAFDDGELPLRPGMGASLTIITLERSDVLLVPNRAIQSVGSRKVVEVVEGRRIIQTEVITGLSNRQETEIVSGLKEGQRVRVP